MNPETTNEIEQIAKRLAERIYPHVSDATNRKAIESLLIELAEEIKREAVEP